MRKKAEVSCDLCTQNIEIYNATSKLSAGSVQLLWWLYKNLYYMVVITKKDTVTMCFSSLS